MNSVQEESWACKVVYPLEIFTDANAVASVMDLAPFSLHTQSEADGWVANVGRDRFSILQFKDFSYRVCVRHTFLVHRTEWNSA